MKDKGEKMTTETAITEFTGRWTRLSNFAPCSVWFDKHIYGSTEHAYQASKTLNKNERRKIRRIASPNEAKKEGQLVTLRKDWESVKIGIMEQLLLEKFAQEPDRTILLSTGEVELVEGNWWGDKFWGQCPLGVGENHLGKLLMKTRTALVNGEI